MNPPVTTRAAPARPGNGSRKDRLWQAIDRQNSNRLHQAQRIDRDIIAAIIGNNAELGLRGGDARCPPTQGAAMKSWGRHCLTWSGHQLFRHGVRAPVSQIEPDETHPGMWRFRLVPDGAPSDMVNLRRGRRTRRPRSSSPS